MHLGGLVGGSNQSKSVSTLMEARSDTRSKVPRAFATDRDLKRVVLAASSVGDPHISFQPALAIASLMVSLRESSDTETPPTVSDTCWAEMTLLAVSWTLEIPLNKYTEALLDASCRFIVDASNVHALHASAVSAELITRFAELREVTRQLRAGSCDTFARE